MSTHLLTVAEGRVRVASWGERDSPALLLLHGFPQTHVMWADLAPQLAKRFFVIAPDLRGYGQSFKPADEPEHAQMSKRRMALDAVALLDHFGIAQARVCGHDRGGRVAHRLALDHPQRVLQLSLIDIAPTLDMYAATNMAFARAYYHWFHLIAPAPLPERMIEGSAATYLRTKLGGWGGKGHGFVSDSALADYEACFTPETIHAMCEDYRASAGIDLDHDRESREQGQKIQCPLQVLWGERGIVHKLFDPLALWQAQAALPVQGQVMPAGHFIPEELPDATAQALLEFFA